MLTKLMDSFLYQDEVSANGVNLRASKRLTLTH
jgi:hypothetical protein